MTGRAGRSIGGGFFILGAGELVARIVAFAVSVYLSRTLGAEGFGIVSFALAVMLYLQRTVGLELEGLGVHEAMNPAAGREVITGLLLVRIVIALGLLLVTWLVAGWLLPGTDARVLSLYAVSLLALSLNVRWVHLVRRRNETPAAARVVGEMSAALIVFLWIRGPQDVALAPLSLMVAELLAAVLLLRRLERPRLTKALGDAWRAAVPVVRRAFPLVLYSLLGLVTFNVDLLMVRVIWGAVDAGYYAAAYALTSLLINLGIAYYANVIPLFARVRDEPTRIAVLYRTSLIPVLAAVLPAVVGGMIIGPRLVTLTFGQGYAPSMAPLRPLMIAAGLTVLRLIPLAVLVTTNRRGQALVVNAIGAALNIGLNLVLIPRYGIVGAAFSTLTTDAIRVAISAWLIRRAGVTPIQFSWIWRWTVATVVMAFPVWLLRDGAPWLSVPAGIALYSLTAFALGAVRRKEGGGWSLAGGD